MSNLDISSTFMWNFFSRTKETRIPSGENTPDAKVLQPRRKSENTKTKPVNNASGGTFTNLVYRLSYRLLPFSSVGRVKLLLCFLSTYSCSYNFSWRWYIYNCKRDVETVNLSALWYISKQENLPVLTIWNKSLNLGINHYEYSYSYWRGKCFHLNTKIKIDGKTIWPLVWIFASFWLNN